MYICAINLNIFFNFHKPLNSFLTMKNVLIVLVMSACGISTAFAQTPTAVPSKGEAKTAVKAAATTTKTEAKAATTTAKTAVKAAATTTKTEVKAAATTAKTEVKAAATTAKTEVKKAASATKAAVKETPAAAATTATKSVKKATGANATKMKAAPMAKMMYKCPKGDALCDTGGKCPKCGTEMVSISAAKKKAKKK